MSEHYEQIPPEREFQYIEQAAAEARDAETAFNRAAGAEMVDETVVGSEVLEAIRSYLDTSSDGEQDSRIGDEAESYLANSAEVGYQLKSPVGSEADESLKYPKPLTTFEAQLPGKDGELYTQSVDLTFTTEHPDAGSARDTIPASEQIADDDQEVEFSHDSIEELALKYPQSEEERNLTRMEIKNLLGDGFDDDVYGLTIHPETSRSRINGEGIKEFQASDGRWIDEEAVNDAWSHWGRNATAHEMARRYIEVKSRPEESR